MRRLLGHLRTAMGTTANCSLLKTRAQLVGESLQEFSAAIKQLTHRVLPGLHELELLAGKPHVKIKKCMY
jgi:hypothetical protein